MAQNIPSGGIIDNLNVLGYLSVKFPTDYTDSLQDQTLDCAAIYGFIYGASIKC